MNECINDSEIDMSIVHCPTTEMNADMFTKALAVPNFIAAQKMIGLVDFQSTRMRSKL